MTAALEIEGLAFSYPGSKALDGIGFAVRAGGVTMLLGPNGAGKTTLFSLLGRFLYPAAGRITAFGRSLQLTGAEALADFGFVFQQSTLDLDLTVEQNLMFSTRLHGLDRARRGEAIEAALAAAGLIDRRRDKGRTLSSGQRRRIEIERALLHRPRLLLLDEPTVGLDVSARSGIIARVRALARERGVAVLWATHLVDEVEPSDAIVLLDRGLVRAKGRSAEVSAAFGVFRLEEVFGLLADKRKAVR